MTMTESFSANGTRDLLTDLCRLVADRAPAELDIPSNFARRNEATENQFQESRRRAAERYEAQRTATREEYASARADLARRLEQEHGALLAEYENIRSAVIARHENTENAAKQELQESCWEATAISEAATGGLGLQLDDIKAHLDARWEELQLIQQEAVEKMKARGHWGNYPDPPPDDSLAQREPVHRLGDAVTAARAQLQRFPTPAVLRLFHFFRLAAVLAFLAFTGIIPLWLASHWEGWYWVAAGDVGVFILMLIVAFWFHGMATLQSAAAYRRLRQVFVNAGLLRPNALQAAKEELERHYNAGIERRNAELKAANDKYATIAAELKRRKEKALLEADEKYRPRLAEIAARREIELKQTDEKYARRLAALDDEHRAASDRQLDEYSRAMLESGQRFQHDWSAMSDRWHSGLERLETSVGELGAVCDRLFPPWDAFDWKQWTPPAKTPPAIRFGRHAVALADLDGGLPKDERLRRERNEFILPALLPFPDRSLLLLKADGDARARAVELIQSVMLRMLVSIPPGKVRFTIIDPVGLGENFSAFMHLADYDEQLVSNRIWTDQAHIEQRLATLTEHMENVLQVYLRNEFRTIQEYNDFAGELAEPYRVLVIANFPANFSESAAARLASIVASGARCGVFTLMSVDAKAQLPRHFELADLEPQALSLCWENGRCTWRHPEFGKLALSFDPPPPPGQFTDIVRAVGRKVKDADRVEVPFESALPDDGQWWTGDSRFGIDVPLGRAGAMKLQHLHLGKGTSQHVLISGKTGSGKSTLLHGLITNLAVRYSPDEVQFYLVDFKKGVEFKGYASAELPHARVIAIESEREFGLSVLDRLDLELKNRGDLFRKLGVQDIQGFRAAQPGEKMPRVLLIIDEFQELFVEDDRIAQNASLLLDRLVRQGRAFGIHVFLGSQTLAGAYSLARSTLGQMAVRIALQCSETDAHLILSEDNTAARLLTRPGEAIYNDANGLFEGNHPFQAVWLSDDRRETYLEKIRRLADQRGSATDPPIVFEGNAPSDLGKNPALREALSARSWPEPAASSRAWLGAAVAIKEATAAKFARQSGSNLLIVGQRDESALGILGACLVSLAAQHRPLPPTPERPCQQFYVLDGTRPDAPDAGFLRGLVGAVPHAAKFGTSRAAAEFIAEIAAELARREQAADEDVAPLFLFLYNLNRFRDLRKAEDDFSFSTSDEGEKGPNPAKQLEAILRDGPTLGIHTILWCDTYNNVSRALDRQSLREFEMRVVFQMNATDSSNLIDTPAASKLGIHRALFYDEGEGLFEKFRPYGLPDPRWLDGLKRQLASRDG